MKQIERLWCVPCAPVRVDLEVMDRVQIVAFISQTSASNASTGANSNLYYLNIFDDAVRGDTGSFQTNAGGRVTRAIQAIAQTGGGTDFSDGVDDLTAQFQGLTGSASFAKIAVVLTDGQSGGAVAASAAALRAEGVTVAAVGLGPNPTASVLSDIASSEDLVFTNVNFDAIRALILQVLTIVGAHPSSLVRVDVAPWPHTSRAVLRHAHLP